ncbi:MAG TPA: cytochrome b N-terminal domain-containing protein [Candidatus Eisenbacteria bacterium]
MKGRTMPELWQATAAHASAPIGYPPPMRLIEWLDDRTGLPGGVRAFLGKRLPRNLPWSYTLGSIALLLFVVQIVTGIFLAVYYAPTPDHAHDSLRWLESSISGGRLLRGMHHWGASFMVVAVLMHLLRVLVHGSYRKPREVNWLVGVKLLLFVMAFGLTGYLLPWDQKAYWATQVTLNIARSVPLAGPFLAKVLGGGEHLGALTLTRFYAIHVLILPLIAIGLVVWHVALVQRHGSSGPPSYEGNPKVDGDTFHPKQSARDAIAMTLVFAALVVTAIVKPAPLEGLADPTDATYVPRPEWYFLGLFQLLKYFPGKLEVIGTVILPGIGTALLFALPWLDRSKSRRYGARKALLAGSLFAFAAAGALTLLGAMDKGGAPEPAWRRTGRTPFFAAAAPSIAARRDCASCHRSDGFGAGPPLAGESWTRNATWIRAHLSDPAFVAPGTREAEDRLSTPDANMLMAWLEQLKDGEPAPSAAADTSAVSLILREGCIGCHSLDGAGGRNGPSLDGVAKRHNADWIVNYLPDPEAINPEAKMRAYPDLTLDERTSIASYLIRHTED